jgi:hypothetical protein
MTEFMDGRHKGGHDDYLMSKEENVSWVARIRGP